MLLLTVGSLGRGVPVVSVQGSPGLIEMLANSVSAEKGP